MVLTACSGSHVEGHVGVTSLSSKQQAAHRAPRPLVSFVEFDLTPLRVCDGKMEAAGGLLRTEKCLHERALETTMGRRPILWIGKLSSETAGGLPKVASVRGRAGTTARSLDSV